MTAACWFAQLPGAGPCDGLLVKAHLIPRQLLKREFPYGVVFLGDRWIGANKYERPDTWCSLQTLEGDPRTWVWGCGGITGLEGHHGKVDGLRLRIPREILPPSLHEFAAEFGLSWWVDRQYGRAET